MLGRVDRPEQVPPKQPPIALQAELTVGSQELLMLRTPEARNTVPGEARHSMVHRVVIVVQVQQPPKQARLVNNDPVPRQMRWPMLIKRTHHGQAECRIRNPEQIVQRRNA